MCEQVSYMISSHIIFTVILMLCMILEEEWSGISDATVGVDSLYCFLSGNLDRYGSTCVWKVGVLARKEACVGENTNIDEVKGSKVSKLHLHDTSRINFVLALFSKFTQYYYT